jgi:hypothetical protein
MLSPSGFIQLNLRLPRTSGSDLPVQVHTWWANHSARMRIYSLWIFSLFLSLKPLGYIILLSNLVRDALIVLIFLSNITFSTQAVCLPKSHLVLNYPCFTVWLPPLQSPLSRPSESQLCRAFQILKKKWFLLETQTITLVSYIPGALITLVLWFQKNKCVFQCYHKNYSLATFSVTKKIKFHSRRNNEIIYQHNHRKSFNGKCGICFLYLHFVEYSANTNNWPHPLSENRNLF